MRLFCFPFAGGSKYSFVEFEKKCPKNLELFPIDYPGRGARFQEALLTSMEDLVKDAFEQIKGHLNQPFAFYGHSMGTVVAVLLYWKLKEAKLPLPRHLYLSGRGGPATENTDRDWHKLPQQAFYEKLKVLGGSPKEVLEDTRLMEIIEPIVRADFQAIESFTYRKLESSSIPLTVMIGKEEETTKADALTWQAISDQPMELLEFDGGHFFIFQEAKNILKRIASCGQNTSVKLSL